MQEDRDGYVAFLEKRRGSKEMRARDICKAAIQILIEEVGIESIAEYSPSQGYGFPAFDGEVENDFIALFA